MLPGASSTTHQIEHKLSPSSWVTIFNRQLFTEYCAGQKEEERGGFNSACPVTDVCTAFGPNMPRDLTLITRQCMGISRFSTSGEKKPNRIDTPAQRHGQTSRVPIRPSQQKKSSDISVIKFKKSVCQKLQRIGLALLAEFPLLFLHSLIS